LSRDVKTIDTQGILRIYLTGQQCINQKDRIQIEKLLPHNFEGEIKNN